MNIKEIISQAKMNAPVQLGKMPEARANRLLREAFAMVLSELEATSAGAVKVGGLGVFQIRQVEVEKDGQKQVVKRIMFKPAPPKS